MSRAFNAMPPEPEQVARTLRALVPPAGSAGLSADVAPDIGKASISSASIERLRTELEANPPQKFDLARKVNVFNAQVEFVEMSLTGTHVRRHIAQPPRDLVFATRDPETQRRVQASFKGRSTRRGRRWSMLSCPL
jgi:hypothetical protein